MKRIKLIEKMNDKIDEINKIEIKIAKIEKESLNRKNFKKCPDCGKVHKTSEELEKCFRHNLFIMGKRKLKIIEKKLEETSKNSMEKTSILFVIIGFLEEISRDGFTNENIEIFNIERLIEIVNGK